MARRFPFRPLRGDARREYERQRDTEYNWAFFKADRTRTDYVDLADYAETVFSHSQSRQSAFVAIVQVFAEKRKPLYLRDVTYAVKKKVAVSNTTLNSVWKSMLRSGMLQKKHRQDPAQLSVQFAERLKDGASYWENMLAMFQGGQKRCEQHKPK
jgi:methyltransferase-like protein